MFLFVAASEVLAVAERMGATPFDVEGDGVRIQTCVSAAAGACDIEL